jgi:hypothetical protein
MVMTQDLTTVDGSNTMVRSFVKLPGTEILTLKLPGPSVPEPVEGVEGVEGGLSGFRQEKIRHVNTTTDTKKQLLLFISTLHQLPTVKLNQPE